MNGRSIFVGPGGIRAGWRFAIFLAIAVALSWLFPFAVTRLGYTPQAGWHAWDFTISDGLGLIALLIAAGVMARIERSSQRRYGLFPSAGFAKRFGEGLLWGTAMVAAVAGLMAVWGGLSISGLALRGWNLAAFAILWAISMLFVGLFEESLFRGYPQYVLASGMGFWPAAILLSFVFGAIHYFTKPRETLVDASSVALIGLFLCLTLRRSGDLWIAVGLHAAFDYVALVILASPNTGMEHGQRVSGHLLETSFQGAAWLTGGECGLEASVFIFPVLAITFLLFSWLHPQRKTAPAILPERGSGSAAPAAMTPR